ncbi:MAG TPA: hypothetical protein VEC59_08470 [Steroidobacteraceae bacterium]|nr:hypothetical protein [Steroidobacteraceae bacterium]
MPYQLNIEQKPGYLQVTVTGRNSTDTVARYMQEVMQEVATRRCPRVLIVENLEGPRLGTMEVFTMVTAGSKRYHGQLEALAFVDLNAEGGVMRFAEDVAVNRGIPVRVFRTLDGAEKWLLAHSHGAGPNADSPTQKP